MSRPKRVYRPRVEPLEDRLVLSDQPNMIATAFSSRPGAPATIYLDFNGHFDAVWAGFNNVDTPPFDVDGTVNSFSAQEQQLITTICRNVAEDYSSFNINVTTVLPPSFARGVAVRVAVGGNGSWLGAAAGGVALLNSFASGAGVTDTCFAFSAAGFGVDARAIADVCSHEAGHTFGLQHQSQYGPTGTQIAPYYAGLPDGTAPVMGNSYAATRSLWWYGTSAISSSTFQDDLAVIGNAVNKFGFRADDYGNGVTAATLLPGNVFSGVNVNLSGVIATMADQDWFRFSARPGPVTFTVDVPDPNNNLDAKIELRDRIGKVIASADPSTSFDATLTFNITIGGLYYAVVSSHGASSSSTANNYGQDIGSYSLIGNFLPLVDSLKIYSPVRWRYKASTASYSGLLSIVPQFDLQGPFVITIKLPDPSVEWLRPPGPRSGNTVRITVNRNISTGEPLHFKVVLRNPLHKKLGTFFVGLETKVG